jgi:hypothetical protein
MKTDIKLNPGMGTAIVEHLRQFGELPQSGILAGQAVDSAITDLFGKGGGVYNDLDIFRNAPASVRKNAEHWATSTAARQELELKVRDGYGAMEQVMELVRTYSIKSVVRQDMLNTVHCTMGNGFMARMLTAHHVISGFDLNCTRVAVDLATGQLAWDRHYEEFLRSRQLRIAMMHTPWHTFLRLAKKAEELPGVYVDFEAAAQACIAVANSNVLGLLEDHKAVGLLFGKKHLEQAEATRHAWTPYFTLEEQPMVQLARGGWELEADADGCALSGKRADLWTLTPTTENPRELQQRCDRLKKGVLFFAQKLVDESRRTKAQATFDKLGTLVAHRNATAAKPGEDFVLKCALDFQTDYVAGQAEPAVSDKVHHWLAKHSLFKAHLYGLSLGEQHARIQEIAQLSREYGKLHYEGDTEQALGVLELQAMRADLDSREAMLALLDADRKQALTPFDIKPLPLPARLPAQFEGFTVTEMLKPLDLSREGREMHHCVGGYSHAVGTHKSRILSIKYRGQRNSKHCSTVELYGKFKKDSYAEMAIKIAQNRTVSNKDPSEENKRFVRFLCDYLAVVDELATASVVQLAADATQQASALQSEVANKERDVVWLQSQLTAARNEAKQLAKDEEQAARRARTLNLLLEAETPQQDGQAGLPADLTAELTADATADAMTLAAAPPAGPATVPAQPDAPAAEPARARSGFFQLVARFGQLRAAADGPAQAV